MLVKGATGICFMACIYVIHSWIKVVNTFRPRQNGRHFADDTFKRIFLNETFRIVTKISLKFVPKGPINNIPALVQIMAWRRSSEKPLSEPMMVRLLTHICVTQPQWVKRISCTYSNWIPKMIIIHWDHFQLWRVSKHVMIYMVRYIMLCLLGLIELYC